MAQGLKDIMEQAGDENVGQTLIRLARLATAVHQHESAEQLRRQFACVGDVAMPQPVNRQPEDSTVETTR